MTFPEFARLEGALICIALAVLLLAIGRVVYELLRESLKWRRLVRAAGGEGPALKVVEMLEHDAKDRRARQRRAQLAMYMGERQ